MKLKETIILDNKEVEYELRLSKRSKNIRIEINQIGKIVLVVPKYISIKTAQKFFLDKKVWILNNLNKQKIKQSKDLKILDLQSNDYERHKELALKILTQKANFFCYFYKINFRSVSIRNPKTRWGSCSSKGNLNFSFKLIFLPDYLADYIVVHEVCHLIEMNHSKRFWALVAKQAPDYKRLRRELRKYI